MAPTDFGSGAGCVLKTKEIIKFRINEEDKWPVGSSTQFRFPLGSGAFSSFSYLIVLFWYAFIRDSHPYKGTMPLTVISL